MKKALLAIAAVALLFATSCNKENVNPAVDVPEGAFLATIDNCANPQNAPVVKDGMTTKTTIDANRYVIWEAGDEIKINGVIFTANTSGNSVVFEGGKVKSTAYHAFFPASIAGTDNAGTLPASQTIVDGKVSNLPMYAYSTDNQLTFRNICAVAKITIPSFLNGATKIELSSDQRMNGAFTVDANNKAVMSTAAQNDADKMVTIAKASGTFATDEVVYIAVPAQAYTNLKIEVFNGTESWWNSTIASCTLDVNKVYTMNDPNLLPGVFSVSATKKVRFTKGNLMTDSITGCHFASSQTDNGDSYTFDKLFKWGSVCGVNDYTILSKDEFCYMVGYLNYDMAGNAGINPCTGRTMTNGAPRHKYPVTIDGKKCHIVFYPDNYANTNPPSSYTAAEWAEAEREGCVCFTSTFVESNRYEWLVKKYIDAYGFFYYLSVDSVDQSQAYFLRANSYYNPNTDVLAAYYWDIMGPFSNADCRIRLVKEYSGN